MGVPQTKSNPRSEKRELQRWNSRRLTKCTYNAQSKIFTARIPKDFGVLPRNHVPHHQLSETNRWRYCQPDPFQIEVRQFELRTEANDLAKLLGKGNDTPWIANIQLRSTWWSGAQGAQWSWGRLALTRLSHDCVLLLMGIQAILIRCFCWAIPSLNQQLHTAKAQVVLIDPPRTYILAEMFHAPGTLHSLYAVLNRPM